MLWGAILTFLVGTIWMVVVFLKAPCLDSHCQTSGNCSTNNDQEPLSLLGSVSACHQVLQSLETQKAQLHNRLAMLDEMIEKSDREIIRMQEQVARMDGICSKPLSETDYEMLSLLQVGGYKTAEIARLTQRDLDELDHAS